MVNQISINSMPVELILPIGDHLRWKDLLNLRQCAKFLYHIFNDGNFWERGYREKFTFVAARALMLNSFDKSKAYLYKAAIHPSQENIDALKSEFFYKVLEGKKQQELNFLKQTQQILISDLSVAQTLLFSNEKKLSEFQKNRDINAEIPKIHADCYELDKQIEYIYQNICLSQDEINSLSDEFKNNLKFHHYSIQLNAEFNDLSYLLNRAFILNVIKNKSDDFLNKSSDFNLPFDDKALDALMVYLQAISTESNQLAEHYLYIQMITDKPDLVPFGRGIVNQMILDGFRKYASDSLLAVEPRLLLCIDSFKQKLQ
jgi:hypothetical protein